MFVLPSYLKIVSTPKTGGQVINYSSRFTITGMTGQWSSPAFESAWEAVKGNPNSVPPTVNTAGGAANVPPGAQGDAAIPYAQQTGQIRFAPMQGHPPTKITKTATDRLYETSAWTVAKEHLPTPFAVKTNTAPITYKFSTRENTVSQLPPSHLHR